MPPGKKTLRILVIGAGIGGLTTAIALRKAGHIVTILEQSLWQVSRVVPRDT
jgi:salicylate hydroxylase